MDDKRLSLIYLALVGTLGVYGLAAYQMLAKARRAADMPMVLAYALMAVAVVETILVIPLLRRMFLPPTREAASLDDRAPTGEAVTAALARLSVAQIITWAMCESIALYGFVLVVMSHDLRYYFGFAALSLLNFLIYRPSEALSLGVARAAAHEADSAVR